MEITETEAPSAAAAEAVRFVEPYEASSDPPASEIALYLAAYRAQHGMAAPPALFARAGPAPARPSSADSAHSSVGRVVWEVRGPVRELRPGALIALPVRVPAGGASAARGVEPPPEPTLTAENGWGMFDPKLEPPHGGGDWPIKPGGLDPVGRRRLAEAQVAFLASVTNADMCVERITAREQAARARHARDAARLARQLARQEAGAPLHAQAGDEVEGEGEDESLTSASATSWTEVADSQFNALGLECAAARAEEASEPHWLTGRLGGGRSVWGWGGCFGHASPDTALTPKSE